ncbi:MAG TPA: molybdopterin-dependent oxidoreductase [Symbiobacteriaceae bacterium]|nr:molybdopterin-dependent oxidoreductase [Symbiobacteriaceae bacterium]
MKEPKLQPPHIKRRTFLKAAGALGAAAAVSGGAELLSRSNAQAADQTAGEIKEFYASCTMECIHCSLIAEVQNGRIINIKGNPNFNTQPCLRGLSRAQWVYSKDRILYPMKRVGERGSGKWERITWDEALDTIAAKIKDVKATAGPKGFLYIGGSGNFASLAANSVRSFFSHLGGLTPTVGTLCCSAVTEAMNNMMGDRYYEFRDTLDQSRYIICWGNNPAVTNAGYYKKITAAVEAGAKLVVIDPRYSETAAKAHEWVAIKPGTDTALAMGMLRVIITEKIYDEKFLLTKSGAAFLLKNGDQVMVENKPQVMDSATMKPVPFDTPDVKPVLSLPAGGEYETVFDMIAREVAPFTPEQTEKVTSVPHGTVVRLAREFAATKPAAIMQNMSGAQRTEFGTYTVASQLYLATFTGNWGIPGAGVNDTGGVNQLFKVPAPVAAATTDPIPAIPVTKFGEYILADKPHKIEMLWVGNGSLMTQYPNTNAVRKAMLKIPFVVAANNVWASHTKYADIVLPATTLWEYTDVLAATRSEYVQLLDKAIDPPGEAHSDAWVVAKLSTRFPGLAEKFDKSEEELCNVVLKPFGKTVADLRKDGPYRPFPTPWVPWKDGIFKTPTKRFHLFVPGWKAKNFSPVVKYYQPKETPEGNPELAAKYPLQMVNRKISRTIHSSFGGGTVPWLNEATVREQQVMIHPLDAEARGIKNGEYVKVLNDRGELRVKAWVTEWMTRGIVSLENGWWEKEGGSSSTLTNDTPEALSSGHSLNNTLVQVKKEA